MPDVLMSEKDIDRTAKQGLKFLGGLNKQPVARAILAERGYKDAEHGKGWSLTLALLGYPGASLDQALSGQKAKNAAVARLDQWDEPNFELAALALKHNFPAQYELLFKDLVAAKGIEAVGSVRTFLTRVRVLREDPEGARAETHDTDLAALAKLEERKVISPEIETELWGCITLVTGIDPNGVVVESAAAPVPVVATPAASTRAATAVQLRNWLEEWCGTAKKVITRRDYLISLGLVQRRKKKGAVEDLETDGSEDVDELVTEEPPPVLPAPASATTTEIPPS